LNRKRKVLVAEGDGALRGAIVETLALAGFQVLVASSGREALWQLSQLESRPCVLVLGATLSGMPAPALLRLLAEQDQLADFPTLLLSAATPPAGLPRCTVLRMPARLGEVLSAVWGLAQEGRDGG
jgi:two-component system, response regulator FlrC